ncbi:MAG: branched-chain amino acid ABC transporter permease [Desulfobulbaceae bacterium]|uniref:Branched-chain amino acid ABC transporter permease n=1 Tax=Candidatus Desulfatifera sulfidica TaxID=2841691 RepID=A0A8J6NBI0_9BACT|nr:branched-chain amino acid ABC transporter permease [Candidatus Desulfatifera sulfidica]
MRAFLRNERLMLTVLLVFALLPPLFQLMGQEYLLSLLNRILIYGLAAASLDLILGYGGMVSLGHAAFLGIGAYSAGILAFHSYEGSAVLNWPMGLVLPGSESLLLALFVAVVMAGFFGLLTGSISLRTRGMHFIMITLAFAQMFYYLFISLDRYGGEDGISLFGRGHLPGFDLNNDFIYYYLCLFILILFLVLARRFTTSRFGLVLRGGRDNEQRLRALGFPVYRYRLICYALAAAAAGVAGVLMAHQGEYVSPGLMHWTKSGEIMVMVLLGGSGTLVGPLLGAGVLLLLEEVLAIYTEHWMVILGPFLILVVLFARNGIHGLLMKIGGRDD